ncbi:hypothetical protein Hypma_005573 [Hypsizygus marmoreus]|uniref:Uncharacterized protein n=1 Tax=Hypsizygus marmoreus TaxID=39966 RepID=A0A369K1W9_HYPMA|nr:hypothetical protein Hypma_005573 [Hypsizygus marmoreus]
MALFNLVLRRDGDESPLSRIEFDEEDGWLPIITSPVLAQIIPNSVLTNGALEYIAMFSGIPVPTILKTLNTVDNLVVMEYYDHIEFDRFKYTIDTQRNEDGQFKYFFRSEPFLCKNDDIGKVIIDVEDEEDAQFIRNDGEELFFGRGPEGTRLGHGPLPLLCDIRLAVQRFLFCSGARDAIHALREDADKLPLEAFPAELVTSRFCGILSGVLGDAKGPQDITYNAILRQALR